MWLTVRRGSVRRRLVVVGGITAGQAAAAAGSLLLPVPHAGDNLSVGATHTQGGSSIFNKWLQPHPELC